jgi:hypothetical protein
MNYWRNFRFIRLGDVKLMVQSEFAWHNSTRLVYLSDMYSCGVFFRVEKTKCVVGYVGMLEERTKTFKILYPDRQYTSFDLFI